MSEQPPADGTKRCSVCRGVFPLSCFSSYRRGPSVCVNGPCKPCNAVKSKAWYHALPPGKKAAVLARVSAWNHDHTGEYRQRARRDRARKKAEQNPEVRKDGDGV